MQRDSIEIFQVKLKKHKIQNKVLATEAGRSAGYISEVLNHKQSPTLESFEGLVQAADRLSPGFADDYYCSLAGHAELNTLIGSLGVSELSRLLVLVSHRLDEIVSSKPVAI